VLVNPVLLLLLLLCASPPLLPPLLLLLPAPFTLPALLPQPAPLLPRLPAPLLLLLVVPSHAPAALFLALSPLLPPLLPLLLPPQVMGQGLLLPNVMTRFMTSCAAGTIMLMTKADAARLRLHIHEAGHNHHSMAAVRDQVNVR
jgi:hypothetical protein